MRMFDSYQSLSTQEIDKFEEKYSICLPTKYKNFLISSNGGYPERNLFHISPEQGSSTLALFFGIGEIYESLNNYITLLKDHLPHEFIVIDEDEGGNFICMGINHPYRGHIYFWDHESEIDNPDRMTNMHFLASDIFLFLNGLYEELEE